MVVADEDPAQAATPSSQLPDRPHRRGARPRTGGGRRRTRSGLGTALGLVGWLVVAVLGLAAVLRVVAWDDLEPLVVVNALTVVVYLPAWLVAAAAAAGRRWLLGGAALVVVAAQLALVSPELLAAAPVPGWASHAAGIRILDANIDKSGRLQPGYAAAIDRYRPDVVAFEEFTTGALASMRRWGLLRRFPRRCSAPAPAGSATGFLLAARWPLAGCRVLTVAWDGTATPFMVSAVLRTPEGPVALRVVHTLAPFPSSWREWVSALGAVDRSVRATGTRRMLMVGDFNATWGNRGFDRLLGDGLVDAAAARGQALAMTWPDGAVVPPFVRIDHVLTGAGLAVTRIAAHAGFGSDHHFLTATVAVRP